MTETEWRITDVPDAMLAFLWGKDGSKRRLVTERKLWLFVVAMERMYISHSNLSLGQILTKCDVAERMADGLATREEVHLARYPEDRDRIGEVKFRRVIREAMEWTDCNSDWRLGHREFTAGMLREIVGNPFRPVRCDTCHEGVVPTDRDDNTCERCTGTGLLPITWLTPTVKALAQAAYECRDMPAGRLDPERLAILADALEDVDCRHEGLLRHLRSQRCRLCSGKGWIERPVLCGPNTSADTMRRLADEAGGPIICPSCDGGEEPTFHVRGCWALDLVLGKR